MIRYLRAAKNRIDNQSEKIAFWAYGAGAFLKHYLVVGHPTITIFGSCRQDSIYKHFRVSRVRDGLTYPHYSKEILQAIKYCLDPEFAKSVPSWVFRNQIIGKKIIKQSKLMHELEKSDFFIIEIASLLEYKFEDVYLHHELFDSPTSKNLNKKYGIPTREQIEVRQQTIEELERDMIEIASLLGKDKVIFTTHLSTRNFGKRAELAASVLQVCEKYKFEFLNPNTLLVHYHEHEIFKVEDVLAHFTNFGHQIMGYRWKEKIEVMSEKRKSARGLLVQKYVQQTESNGEFKSGIGDFMNGSLKVFEVAKDLRKIPAIDFSGNPISEFLMNNYLSTRQMPESMIFHENSDLEFTKYEVFFTNKVSRKPISMEARDFIYRNILTPKKEFSDALLEAQKNLGISGTSYQVLHLRVGDRFDENPSKKTIDEIERQIQMSISEEAEPWLLMSNSNLVRQHFRESEFIVPKIQVKHTSDTCATPQNILETLVEFFLMSRAKAIFSMSTYGWGSGFSQMAAEIGQVPITKITLAEE